MRILLLAVGVILLFFQNCSDVQLATLPVVARLAVEKPTGSMCAPEGFVFGAPQRIVFVVDMSMSNVGTLITSTVDYKTSYRIDTTDGPTDLKGDRFAQIRNFIENCGGSDNIKYSIIGFADRTIFSRNNSCLSPFESQQEALYTIDSMKAMQDADVAKGYGYLTNPFTLGGQTYYNTAIKCVEDKINEEITLEPVDKPIYSVFFVTDGQTTDPPDKMNYAQTLTEMQLAVSSGASALNFYPVFYTAPGAKNFAEKSAAVSMLDSMAHVINPSINTTVLSSLAGSQSEFCKFVKPEALVSYDLKNAYAINLNSIADGGVLYPDSDSDGLSDSEENNLSFNPTLSRTTGILDGLCQRLNMGPSECELERGKITCDPGLFLPVGLNQCDQEISQKIFGSKISGVDYDKDMVPDFIEIIRHMSPERFDVSDNPAGDGITNFQKIISGMDVQSSQILHPLSGSNLIKMTYSENPDGCAGDLATKKSYSFNLQQVPLLSTLAYHDDSTAAINLSHKSNENVIMIISYWQAVGGKVSSNKIFGQIFLMDKLTGRLTSSVASPKLLGEYQ